MTYLDEIAEAIRAAVPDDALPDGNTDLLFRIYALLVLAKGRTVTAADIHDAWSVWMQEHNPKHPSLRPFRMLSAELRDEDQPFVDAVRRVAHQLVVDRK